MAKILIIEDDRDIQELLRQVFLATRHEIRFAGNGIEGLEQLEGFQPDLVILDILLPTMDGWQFAKKKRDSTKFASIPLIILTCLHQIIDVAMGRHWAGAVAYLTKPFSPPHLLAEVESHLQP